MARYSKFIVAVAGIGVLIGLQQFRVEIPGLGDVVRDLIVGALVAGGVYRIPNQGA
ncbi:hypothetical protein [Mesorhizobium sp. STM 4661]|uniref:hypothetical protein n=1 Tax=Mesorhizobium sp. STM 4661 TaxID=1297570 RepID=UPI0002BDCCDF|nr:hypothetical protein [Mesorhizobium sp. STM 4661]CCV14965.1 conserved hypothetical protein [Mesorhizobium sp. STM 4661]